ncbi:phosphoglycolate phosphatase [Haloprofundus salilacus]|uniref:phosphoglycolate phosphatase n=1 Tax=Haloprofundus salilacus TaxID=2876190 RepID=UPI001CCC36F2|nr:phosphoglycolate phosphatase [Haloprofundus salilacus]
MAPPLALDIDGTLTRSDGSVDPRLFDVLRDWDAPVVLATGKSFPYPVALCHFVGIPETVVAENGGVVYAADEVTFTSDRESAAAVSDEFVARGGDLGWGRADTANRWRETEIAVNIDADEALLRAVADEYGMEVVDTGYAYHVKSPGVSKAKGLKAVCETLSLDPTTFVAVGDSENDVSTFELVDESYAVANADDRARAAAGTVIEESYSDGTLSVLKSLR